MFGAVFEFDALDVILAPEQHDHYEAQAVKRICPPGLPPRWKYGDEQCGALFVPDAVVVGANDAEGVSSRIDIGITGYSVACICFNPFGFIGLELGLISILSGTNKIQSSELESEVVLNIGQLNIPRKRDIFM